jgi:IS30 family transposase
MSRRYRPRRPITVEETMMALTLYTTGMSVRQIARELDRCYASVHAMLKRMNVHFRPQGHPIVGRVHEPADHS